MTPKHETPVISVTLDIDWAPDFAIDYTAEKLVRAGVKATWFVTHTSPAVDRLRQRPNLFELGIHPNFLANSSHGKTPREVLEHCLSLVPDAVSMRAHSLFQSWEVLDLVLRTTPIMCDVSIFLPRAENAAPTVFSVGSRKIVRLPFIWEDDYEMRQESTSWRAVPILSSPGIKVFNFHPLHVFLNGADLAPYEELKRRASGRLQSVAKAAAEDLVAAGAGPRAMFDELLGVAGGICIRDHAASCLLPTTEP